ncbi:hypothetical protein LUZ60_010821 [Juncus effusus]|nr:hypothetical protein LUZ60_010821 [Juncus effusus]
MDRESPKSKGKEKNKLAPSSSSSAIYGGGEEETEEAKKRRVISLPSSHSSPSSSTPAGRRLAGGGAMCQAERCTADLSEAKRYHRRHKVCEVHSKAPVVIVSGLRQRFCQQCSRFHELSEFDDSKRSCRRRLAGHNERRRKSSSEQGGTTTSTGGGEGSGRCRQAETPQDTRRIPLNVSENPPPFKHFHIS